MVWDNMDNGNVGYCEYGNVNKMRDNKFACLSCNLDEYIAVGN